MKPRRPRFAAASLCALCHTAAVGAPQVTTFPDMAWAGHSVRFGILTEREHQFVAYYDKDRRMMVAGRRLGSDEWVKVHPQGKPLPKRGRNSNVTGWDSHNYLELAMDRDGQIHLSGNMHGDPLIYYRTTRPFDITSLECVDRMTGDREDEVTYPVFFKNPAGDLVFRYRDGGSGRGSDLYNIYDPDTKTWRRLLSGPLLDGEGHRNAYATDPLAGPDGFFHLAWMWRDTPDCSTNHTLCYARSRDLINWETSAGEPIELPITLGRSEVVDPAPVKEGLINMTFQVGFDGDKRPVLTWHRYDKDGRSQIYAARPRPDGGPWDIVQLSDWNFRWGFSGGGSISAEVMLGAPQWSEADGAMFVDFVTTHAPGKGRFKLDSQTLRTTDVLPPTPDILPAADLRPTLDFPGLVVQTAVSRDGEDLWVLRWETLPVQRDAAHDKVPPPSSMTIHRIPETGANNARRVGS